MGEAAQTPWRPDSTHVPLPGTSNLRDLGGTPGVVGTVVTPRLLYRAEALVEPGANALCAVRDPALADAYAALGVRTVIDLRTRRELDAAPSAWPTATGADLVALPMEGGEGDTDYVHQIRAGERTRFTVGDLADFYGLTLQRRRAEVGSAVRVLADPARLPVLVHCAAGKDRTGLLVALVLEALGAPREVVVAEYALTATLRPDRVHDYASLFAESGVDLAAIAPLFDAPADAMARTLDRLDAEYGSPVGYLRDACEVAGAELESLRRHLLVAVSPS